MTKKTKKKRALMSSIISLILCISMLLGTTMAWFTDTASNIGNRIRTGDFGVDLLKYYAEDGKYNTIKNREGDIFVTDDSKDERLNGILWEPGKTEVVLLQVENTGNLALNYNIILDVTNETDVALEKALSYAIIPNVGDGEDIPEDVTSYSSLNITSWNDILAQGAETGVVPAGTTKAAPNGALLADESDYFALAVHMDEDAGNEYQNQSIVIDVKVEAKQMVYESDSFGDQYDLNASYAYTTNNVYKNLYLSPDGDDTASGEAGASFKTLSRVKEEIAKINDNMSGDIVVNIAPGEYKIEETEIFTEEHGGKNGYNVIFRGSSESEESVFTGGTEVTGWEQYEENPYIWKASLEDVGAIRNLYVNGLMAQKARSKYQYRPTEDYTAEGSEYINDGVAITEINFPEHFERPQDIELCWQMAWTLQITPVENIFRENGMVYFVMDQPYYNWARTRIQLNTSPGAYRRFHIQNAFELLDEPGEFYYNVDEEVIYYYPFLNEDLTSAETYVGTTELMFSVSGTDAENKVQNIIFDNLSIKYGAWNEPSKIGMTVDQGDKFISGEGSDAGRGGRMVPAQLDIKNAEGSQILNCEFSCLGSSAIAMTDGVSNSKIIGNSIHDISGTGIMIGHWDHNDNHPEYANLLSGQCTDIDIENNLLTRTAYEYKGCPAISVYYEKNINVLHNYIKDTAYSGITLGWGWGEAADFGNIKVSCNYVENPVIPPVLDGGHIYTLGPLKDSEISYNYFHGAEGLYGGIYPDSGSAYLNIHHNVIDESPHWFFGGLYETHDIYAHENYSDTEVYYDNGMTDGYEGENNIEQATIVKDGAWPVEAQEIMNNAGLEPMYKGLLADPDIEYPEWRTDFVKEAPDGCFVVPDAAYYEAEDFNEGGEGVGYHKVVPVDNITYRPGDVLIYEQEDSGDRVIGGTNAGEWLAYDVDIYKTGQYDLILIGANAFNYEAGEGVPYVNVYIDGELKIEEFEFPQTETWSINAPFTAGTLDMTEGEHLVKIEFVNNGFSFDKFKFQDVETKDLPETTSPYYDEMEFVYETVN